MDISGESYRESRSILAKPMRIVAICILSMGVCLGGIAIYCISQFPSIERLGTSHATIGEWPSYVPNAFIAIEDRRFYSHYGIELSGSVTLTQQLARTLSREKGYSFGRRVQDILFPVWLEFRYDKKEILEHYLDTVYLGAGAYGVEEAARRYYDKPAAELTLAEAALLAGIVKAPSRYAPDRDIEAAEARAKRVLEAMEAQGMVSSDQVQEAKRNSAEPVR